MKKKKTKRKPKAKPKTTLWPSSEELRRIAADLAWVRYVQNSPPL